jgi:serine/threonine protein phosphatase PrpC
VLSRWLIGWVGDCRVYRLAMNGGGALTLMTRDDTYRNLGETPPPGGSPDDPARMVGNGAIGEPNVALTELAFGEALLLVTDGVFKHVTCSEMSAALAEPIPLAQRCIRLIQIARARGSTDDATAVVVHRNARIGARLRKLARASALALLAALVVLVLASSVDVPLASVQERPPHADAQVEWQA